MSKIMRAIGLMSGTSLDGIDVALLETDGGMRVTRGPSLMVPYDAISRQQLAEALEHARGLTERTARPGRLAAAEQRLTELHAAAVSEFLRAHSVASSSIDVIGFHGQTVLHRPEIGLTVQLGDGQLLADTTRLPIVFDMRAADVAAGGQGAPLVPIYHFALTANRPERPLAIVNVGGVANVTWIGRDGRLIAFDTGPGTALIDDWMLKRSNQTFDDGGACAARGRVDDDAVHAYLNDPFFAAAAPKSLDRNAFYARRVVHMGVEDGAATLTAFTASAIAKAREHLPEEPALWIVAGGGRRNKTLMRMLAGRVQNAVIPSEAAGLDGDSLEAEAWAYLAVRSLRGLPLTFPGTTGVASPLTGGVLALPKAPLVH